MSDEYEYVMISELIDDDYSDENNLDTEEFITNRISEQFNLGAINDVKTNFLDVFAKEVLNIDLNSIELYQVEMFLTESEQQNSFDYLMNEMKSLFYDHFGMNLLELQPDVADFDLIYNLYDMFIVNVYKTIAYFLLGLKSKENHFISNPLDYTLQGGYKNYINNIKNTNIIDLSIESLIENSNEMDENIKNNITGLNNYVSSSESFRDLYNRTVLDNSLMNLDLFFEILYLADQSIQYIKIRDIIDRGLVPFENSRFRERIRAIYKYPENMDVLESLYRNLDSVQKKKKKENNLCQKNKQN